MRILHYCRSFSPLSQTFVYSYICKLEEQGVSNHVLTHQRENATSRPFPRVTVVSRPNRWHPRRLWHRVLVPFGVGEARTSDWPQSRERLAAVVRRIEPDVIHSHFGQAGVLMAPVAKAEGVPLVVGFYGRDISALPKEAFWRSAYRDLWSQVKAVTVLSDDMASKAQQLECPPEKTTVVHLSRDLNQFPFHSPERTVQTVLFVGRLTPKKAPLDAIQAVELANAQGADLSLELIGDGTLRKDVEQYVRKQHLQETVTIRGKVPSAEIASHMQKADAFILPSKRPTSGDEEGTPTVLVEAQASGLPCVSTWHAGIPEMIPEAHHDLLVAEGDVSGLAECLSRLSARSAEKLTERAERGRRYVEQEFNLTGEVKKLRGVYEKAVAAWV